MINALSLIEFQDRFGTEDACFDYMVSKRWPNGFVCPKCCNNEAYVIKKRKLFQCKSCRHQASVTAGTIFHKLRQPLRKLFLAVYLFSTSKKGISALELQRKLGLRSYRTAWMLLHKLRKGMTSSGTFPLTDPVEIDETYIGGSRHGPAGRGAKNKALVVVAVETRSNKHMGRSYLKQIQHADKSELGQFVRERVQPGTKIKTDGWASYSHLQGLYEHEPMPLKDPEQAGKLLPKVHIVIANVKMWLRGTFNRYPSDKYLSRYLDEFEFRFNRRWRLDNIFDKLLDRCIQRTTISIAELKA